MTKSQKLAQQLLEKRGKFDTIFAKGDDASEDEVKEAGALVTEIEDLQQKFIAAEALENFAKSNSEKINEMKNTPANPIVHSKGEKAQFQGFEKEAGKTYIEDGVVVGEDGHLGIDAKTYAAINEKSYVDSFRAYLKKGIHGLTSNELKDMQVGVDSDGGYLVPAQMLNKIIERKPAPARVAGRVTSYQTSSDVLEIPKGTYSADDIYTSGMRVEWTGENPSSDDEHKTNTPKTGLVKIPIHTAMISCEVTNNQLEDSSFNVQGWLSSKFRETIDLLRDNMVLNGSGIGQPAGILLNPGGDNQPGIVKTGDANLVTADGIIDLAYAVPEQYDDNCVFVFNKTNTGKAIAKLKDNDDRYLFNAGAGRDGVASARPSDLVGYPFLYSAFMPNVAANAFPMIFGDLRGYYLVDRIGFSLQVLNEVEARRNKKVLLGRVRFGGQTVEDWRLKIAKVAA